MTVLWLYYISHWVSNLILSRIQSITIKGKVTKIPIGHRLLWSALIGRQVSVSRHPSKMWSDCFLCSLGEGSVVLWLEQLPWQQKFSGSIPELGSFSTSVALHIVTVVTWKLVDGWRRLLWYHHINDGSLMAQLSRTHNRQWIIPESCTGSLDVPSRTMTFIRH